LNIQDLAEKWNRLLELADAVDTSELSNEMDSRVYQRFRLFFPLRVRRAAIPLSKDEKLIVGRWLSIRYSWGYEEQINSRVPFFKIIRQAGTQIAEVVRPRIRDDFAKAVSLVQQLKPFDESQIRRELRPPLQVSDLFIHRRLRIEKFSVYAVEIYTHTPQTPILSSTDVSGGWTSFNIESKQSIFLVSQLYNVLTALYVEAASRLKPIIEHNKRILEQFDDLMAPYTLSKTLKR